MTFEQNEGQVSRQYRFVSRHEGVQALFSVDGPDFSLRQGKSARRLGMRFVSAADGHAIEGEYPLAGRANYLRGQKAKNWITSVSTFGQLRYANLYPGIDLLFHADDSGLNLEHDFVIAPGADPQSIRFEMRGADALNLRHDGQLEIEVHGKSLVFHSPLAYQETPMGRVPVEARFRLTAHGVVGFHLGKYDRKSPLTIDPVLTFATYLDGDDSESLRALASDASGNIYAVGHTLSTDFPTSNAEQPANMGQEDAFIAKLDPTGHTLIYSTYLGGSNTDEAESVAVDANGNVVVSGTSLSSDFPQAGQLTTTHSAYSETFVASLNASGSTLRYSGFLGASDPFQQPTYTRLSRVAVDTQGNAYVAGLTNDPTFTLTPGAYGSPVAPYPSDDTIFLVKIQSDGSAAYKATIPLTPAQQAGSEILALSIGNIAVDATGAVVLGGSAGNALPTTAGTLSPAFPNNLYGDAGFALKLNAAGSALLFSTYLPGTDTVTDLALDSSGNVYLGGITEESNLPTTATSLQKVLIPRSSNSQNHNAAFVLELSSDGTTALNATYFEGATPQSTGGTDIGALVLGSAGNVVVAGATQATDLPLKNPLMSVINLMNSDDLYLAQFSADLSTLELGTFLHANDASAQLAAVAPAPSGHILLSGSTLSSIFPTTAGALQPVPPPPVTTPEIFIAGIDPSVAAPSLCFDVTGVNFGAVLVNTVTNDTVNVTNCGNAPLTFTSVTSSDPTVTVTQNCSAIVPAATCQLQLAYSPTASGIVQGSLTLNGNNAISPQFLPFAGTANYPQVTLPSSLVFDDLLVGQTGSVNGIYIMNQGGGAFLLSSATVTGDFQITQNSCNNPVPVNGNCEISLNFSPTAAGLRTGVVTLTDNLNPGVQTIALSGNGLTAYPVPTITQILATPAGTSGIGALSLYGGNFFRNSTVLWNGQSRTTHYQSEQALTADLLPADLQQVGEALVSVSTPAPGGGISAPSIATIYGRLQNILVLNEVFEPHSQLIYATIAKTSKTNANSVVAIDPVAMKVVKTLLTGNSPDAIAVSDDGSMLYVGLDDIFSVTQIALPGGTQNFTVQLPSVTFFQGSPFTNVIASALTVVPGQPHTWVAGLFLSTGDPGGLGVAVFDDATVRPAEENDEQLTADSFVFVNDPAVVYSTGVSVPDISVYQISSSGIKRTALSASVPGVGGSRLQSDGQLIYDSTGQVINPATLMTEFTYPQATGRPGPLDGFKLDAANQRLYFAGSVPYSLEPQFLGNLLLTAVDQKTKSTIGQIGFNEESDADSLERFGSNGLALNQGNQWLFLKTSLTGTPIPTQSVAVSPASLSFGSQTQGTTSAAQKITLANTGTAALTISAITATGDYSQTNNCGTSLAVSASCIVSVSFTPTATGDRTGQLTIADDAPGNPQIVSLDGNGTAPAPPLTLAPQSAGGNAITVAAGGTATFHLTLSTASYQGVVGLSCTGVPAPASCSIAPAAPSVTPGTPTAFAVTVTTASSNAAASLRPSEPGNDMSRTGREGFGLLTLLSLPVIFSIRNRRRHWVGLMLLVLAISFDLAGCGSASPGKPVIPPNNLPAGTYQLTITAVAATDKTTEVLTLTVQ